MDVQSSPLPSQSVSALSEQGDPRHVAEHACRRCRVRKVKCDRTLPSCTQCVELSIECELQDIPKRKRKSPIGAKDIKAIGDRLGNIEACLVESGLMLRRSSNNARCSSIVDLETSQSSQSILNRPWTSSDQTRTSEVQGSSASSRAQRSTAITRSGILPFDRIGLSEEELNQDRGALVIETSDQIVSPHPSPGNQACLNFFWPLKAGCVQDPIARLLQPQGVPCFSSIGEPVVTLCSTQGFQLLRQISDNSSFQSLAQAISASMAKRKIDEHNTLWQMDLQSELFTPLPSRNETLFIINCYFQLCNSSYPLFHRPTFMQLLQRQYAGTTPAGPEWFACLNIAIAMGARVLAMATVAPPEKMEPKQPFQYLSNVTRILPDLLTQRPSLLGAQALIGIAAFMQTTDTPAPSFPLLAAAMRQIQQLNFDDADFGDFSGKHFEQRQARRCFWLAFSLDNDITLQFGTALPHSDAELEKGLSCEDYDEDDLMLLPDEQTTHVNVFRARVKLALIQSRIYSQLYSSLARKQHPTQIISRVACFDHDLKQWRNTLPESVRPPCKFRPPYTTALLQTTLLHLRYYHTLLMVHHMSVICTYNSPELASGSGQNSLVVSNPSQVYHSINVSLAAAKEIVTTLKCLPLGTCSNALNWLVLNTALTAFSILFTHTFQNPGNPNAESDLELMHTVVEIITVFEQSDANINCMPELLIICQELEKIAINAVARQHPEQLLPEFTEMEFPQDLLQDLFDVSYSMQGADSQATDGALPSTHSAFYPPSNSALNPQWTHSDFSTALGLDNSTT